jgi:hypothetical protein
VAGDLLEALGRDGGNLRETEVGVAELVVLADEAIGVGTADAGAVLAKLIPGEAEVVEHMRIADLLETLRARRRTTAADGGERLLEPDSGAQILVFFTIHRRFSIGTLRKSEEVCCKEGSSARTSDRYQSEAAFSRLPATLFPTLLSRGGCRGPGWEREEFGGFGLCFVGEREIFEGL